MASLIVEKSDLKIVLFLFFLFLEVLWRKRREEQWEAITDGRSTNNDD